LNSDFDVLLPLSQLNDDDQVKVYLGKKKQKPTGKIAKFIWDCY